MVTLLCGSKFTPSVMRADGCDGAGAGWRMFHILVFRVGNGLCRRENVWRVDQ